MVSIEVISGAVSCICYVVMALVLVFGRKQKTEVIVEQIFIPTSDKEIKKALAKVPEPVVEPESAKVAESEIKNETFKVEM